MCQYRQRSSRGLKITSSLGRKPCPVAVISPRSRARRSGTDEDDRVRGADHLAAHDLATPDAALVYCRCWRSPDACTSRPSSPTRSVWRSSSPTLPSPTTRTSNVSSTVVRTPMASLTLVLGSVLPEVGLVASAGYGPIPYRAAGTTRLLVWKPSQYSALTSWNARSCRPGGA